MFAMAAPEEVAFAEALDSEDDVDSEEVVVMAALVVSVEPVLVAVKLES